MAARSPGTTVTRAINARGGYAMRAGGRLLRDLSAGHHRPGSTLFDWQTGTPAMISSNGSPESIGMDGSVLCDGLPTLKCVFKAGVTYIGGVNSLTLRAAQLRSIQIPVRFSSNVGFTDASNPIQIWLDNTGLSKTWKLQGNISTLRAGAWHVLSFRAGGGQEGWTFSGGPTASTDLDLETIQRIRIVCATPAGSDGVTVNFGPIMLNQGRKGIVVLTADGEYDSQVQYIAPMANGYGLPMTFFLTHHDIGLTGRATWAQIEKLRDLGNGFGHHTFDSSKTGGYGVAAQWATAADITADILAGVAERAAHGITDGTYDLCHGFSYPWDQTLSQARQDLVTSAFQAAGVRMIRKSVQTYNRLQNIARPQLIDPYLIQGALQVTATAPAQTLTLGSSAVGATTATAGGGTVFVTTDVGREILGGAAGAANAGVAVITGYTDATHVNVNVTSAFSSTTYTSGNWVLADASQQLINVAERAALLGEAAIITMHRSVRNNVNPASLEIRDTHLDVAFARIAELARQGHIDVLTFSEFGDLVLP